jgi:hypothetical protein
MTSKISGTKLSSRGFVESKELYQMNLNLENKIKKKPLFIVS